MRLKPDFKRFLALLGLNFLLALAVCSYFLLFAGGHPLEQAYAATALVSNTAMLLLAAALPALLLYLIAGPAGAGVPLAALQLFLATDAAVYKIFKFHLNSMVLNLVLTPGGLESLDQGWGTKALFVLLALAAGAAQWWFWRLSAGSAGWRLLKGRRPLLLAGLVLLFAAADKGLSAWGILYDSVPITRNAQLFPFYQPLRLRSFAARHLGIRLDNEVRGGIDSRYSGLAYPKAPLRVAPPARPLNVLFLVVDSLRADMLAPDVMPEAWKFGKKATVFADHYSGGDCTRFGIFSMLYGLYGNYWFPMLGERRGPVLLEELKRQGYDLRIYASAKLSFPEFNKTCFVDVPRADIYDEPPGGDGAARDRAISEKFVSFLKSRDGKKPYFAFLFYDASHGNYDPQPGLEKFEPSFPVSQLALNKGNVGGLFNRYRNSVLGDDMLIGGILKELAARGGLKNTVVLVTGDHGEAFLERGRYGHNQGYSPEEVRVPLVFYEPGRAPGVVKRVTSHLDIAPTLLALAGVRNPAADYASGQDLFDAAPRPYVTSASWDTAAILTSSETLEMPLEAYRGGLKVFDAEYRELPGSAARPLTPLIVRFQKEARRFSK